MKKIKTLTVKFIFKDSCARETLTQIDDLSRKRCFTRLSNNRIVIVVVENLILYLLDKVLQSIQSLVLTNVPFLITDVSRCVRFMGN